MQLIQNYKWIKQKYGGCVLSIGNFDGVHLGHQNLLAELRVAANRLKVPAVVMLFEPQPLEFFSKEQAPKRLMSLRDKCCHLVNYGVDYVICVRFSQQFAQQSAEDFVQQTLVEQLAVRHLIVGEDFQFGAQRQGNSILLQQLAYTYGFTLQCVNALDYVGTRISSTIIRSVLLKGEIAAAETLLGHPYTVTGRVRTGRALGRTIGFPTANLAVLPNLALSYGVYAVEIVGITPKNIFGVANLGVRPSVAIDLTPLFEVHLFDFNQNIYGKRLTIMVRKKLRDERKFESLDELRQQIDNDVVLARAMLSTYSDGIIESHDKL